MTVSLNITTLNNSVMDSVLLYFNATKTTMDYPERYTSKTAWGDVYLNNTDTNEEQENSLLNFFQNFTNDTAIFSSEFITTTLPELTNENNVSELSGMGQLLEWNVSGTERGGDDVFNVSVEEYLGNLNKDFAHRVLAAVVALAVLMVLGVVGNILVLFVYTRRTKRGTVTRFIQALAVFDLLSCCVAIPGEIIDMTNNYTFGRDPLCKVVRTVNLFCTIASGATLVVVAIDRYKRICCPLRRQISPKGAVAIACCCALISLLISLPTATLYGRRTITTDLLFVNGTDCSINDQFVNTMFPLAYNGLQMLLFVTGAITLIVLYILVGSKVCRHVNQQVKRRKSLSLGRSRFSPGNPSLCSSYSTNMDNVCRLKSYMPIPLDRDDSTELLNRVKIMDTEQEIAFNVVSMLTASVQEKASTDFTSESKNPLVNDKKCQQNGTGITEGSIEIMENSCCHSSIEETVDKYSLLTNILSSNKSETGNIVDASQIKNSIKPAHCEEIHVGHGSKEEVVGGEESNDKLAALNHSQHNVRPNTTLSENVSLTGSKSDNQLHQSNITVSFDVSISDGSLMYLQPQSFHQSLHELSAKNVGIIPVTNYNIKQEIPLCNPSENTNNKMKTDISSSNHSTNSDYNSQSTDLDNSCTSSPPDTPLEKQDNPTRLLLKMHSTKTECGDSKGSNIKTRNTKSNLPNDKTTSRNEPERSCLHSLASKHSHAAMKLHKNESFSAKTQLQASVANDLFLRRETGRKDSGRLRLKRYLSFGYFEDISEAPSEMLLNKSVVATDGNVGTGRADEKKRVKDTINKNGTRRTTLMLFLITIVYILSFLPHLVLMTVKALDEDWLNGHGASWELAQNLLIRSYFINSMANPIIYSFFSKNFFADCQTSVKCC